MLENPFRITRMFIALKNGLFFPNGTLISHPEDKISDKHYLLCSMSQMSKLATCYAKLL